MNNTPAFKYYTLLDNDYVSRLCRRVSVEKLYIQFLLIKRIILYQKK